MTRDRLRSARQFLLGCLLTAIGGTVTLGFAYAAHARGQGVVSRGD